MSSHSLSSFHHLFLRPFTSTIASDVTKVIGNTPLIYLNRISKDSKAKIAVKCEFMNPCSSAKDRTTVSMMVEGEKQGWIQKGTTIIEASSGNTGIALSAFAAAKGYHLKVVMPENNTLERRILMRAFGSDVILTPKEYGMKGAREKAKALEKALPNAYFVDQFSNRANVQSHFTKSGPELWRDTDGTIDCFVAGIGTGGTVSGVGKFLKSKNPLIQIVGVEPFESHILSGGVRGPHKIEGIGVGFTPDVFDRTYVDRLMQVTGEEAMAMARRLAKEEGILGGPSSGATVAMSLKLAEEEAYAGKLIVANLSDSGERYLTSDLYAKEREEMIHAPVSPIQTSDGDKYP